MMDDITGRLALPMLEPGQAQKEATHNEALIRLDLAVQATVAALGEDDPPADPTDGACWIVGDAPTGDWADQPLALAGWTAGGWRFVAPFAGMTVWSVADDATARFDGSVWRIGELTGARLILAGEAVVGPRAAAIADPVGGGTIDAEARAALTALLAALRQHGLIDDA